jgi:hypothetical protein
VQREHLLRLQTLDRFDGFFVNPDNVPYAYKVKMLLGGEHAVHAGIAEENAFYCIEVFHNERPTGT